MKRAPASPLAWMGSLLCLYLTVPVAFFLYRLATTSGPRGFHTPGLFPALSVSVMTASISTALIALFGIPLAYVLAHAEGRIAGVVGVAVQLPLAFPPLMSGILLIYLVGPYSVVGRAVGGRLTDSIAGVVLAQTFVASPFLIVAARSAFAASDPSLLDMAATLGHRRWSRFHRVALPLAGSGIRAGLVLTWLRAFGEYGATVVLAYHPFTLPVYSYNQFSSAGLPTTQAPTALALAAALVVIGIARLPLRRRSHRAGPLPVPVTPPPTPPAPVRFDLDYWIGTFHLQVNYAARSANLAILGPSGSGKSATLRSLAGLFGPSPGPVRYGERSVEQVPMEERRVGYVAQGSPLFPHLTVWQHLLFPAGATGGIASYWLARLGLEGLEDRLPAQLSGGQRQRVALAQALCRAPDLLLLDEPFSALDTPVRDELRRELRRLQRTVGLSTVVVTHDPEEAALLSDEVAIVVNGAILQAGPREELFARPASPAVAGILGIHNLHPADTVGNGTIVCDGVRIETDTVGLAPGTPVWWSIRPERLAITESGGLPCTLVDAVDLGVVLEVTVAIAPGVELRSRRADLPFGDLLASDLPARSMDRPCGVTLPPDAITVWPRTARTTV